MGVLIILLAALIRTAVTSLNFVEDPDSIHSCDIGDVIQNGRTTCTCTENYVYECIFKNPSTNQLDKPAHRKLACQPNKIYVQETITCICNYNGTWPHSACGDVFDSLPAHDVIKRRCEPNGYVFIGCNVCRCDFKGYIDKSRCTKNECHTSDKSPKIRRSSKASNVYGNCEAKNWYSLAPCQFCFCLNENKLVCNTGNYNTKKLQLGSYNLNVCGKELIREAIELIPEDDKTLRHGEGTSTIATSYKPSAISQPNVVNSNGKIDIDVTLDDKQYQDTQISEKHNEQQEDRDRHSYSESVEDKGDYDMGNKEETIQESTKLPHQDDYQLGSKETRDLPPANKDDVDDGSDNEITGPGLKIPARPLKEKKPVIIKNLEDLGQQLKFSLPLMLDKVFRMALRKSMVTIDTESNCIPGSVNTVECNTCFCMKNSKLLCTNKKCD